MMQGDVELVGAPFGERNMLSPLSGPDEMAAYLSAQAVLSPVTRMLADAADWLAERVSDKAEGEAFLRMLVASSLAETPCDALLDALNTPGGFNRRLRQHVEAHGLSGLDDMV